jgi:hypothetical protein
MTMSRNYDWFCWFVIKVIQSIIIKLLGLKWRNSFQGRTQEILSSILMKNNVWSVRMLQRTSWISRPSLMGWKPVWKQKKKLYNPFYKKKKNLKKTKSELYNLKSIIVIQNSARYNFLNKLVRGIIEYLC